MDSTAWFHLCSSKPEAEKVFSFQLVFCVNLWGLWKDWPESCELRMPGCTFWEVFFCTYPMKRDDSACLNGPDLTLVDLDNLATYVRLRQWPRRRWWRSRTSKTVGKTGAGAKPVDKLLWREPHRSAQMWWFWWLSTDHGQARLVQKAPTEMSFPRQVAAAAGSAQERAKAEARRERARTELVVKWT